MKFLGSLAVLSAVLAATAKPPAKREYDTHDYYALEHNDTSASLDLVAQALGVEVVEQAGALKDVWLVRIPKPQLGSRGEEEGFDRVLRAFEDLKARAESRSLARSEEQLTAREIVSSIQFLERQELRTLTKRAPPPIKPQEKADAVAKRLGIQDPLFPQQWHLVNDEYPEHTMNVLPIWDMGYTGKGVATSFIDDGLDFESEDLKDAFDAENSYDFNLHVELPRPVTQQDSHGTRCAGQVAAQRNGVCGVGIAHESTVAGVRILGGPITTTDEAAALNYGYQTIDIYSCSWGPPDNGERMEGPRYLVRKAVTEGINNGRGGKGSIFVFASGNGGDSQDQCNFDGYTNSIYSVTVSAIDYKGGHPSYAEACTANMIVAYTSGGGKAITTTDRGRNACTHSHGGTSAAAPNAAGVFALALQARPALTWRDIQHLCVQTAVIVDPEDHGWERTATGRKFNNKYGYGALDGAAYVTAAQRWKLVKPQAWLHLPPIRLNEGKMFEVGKENYTYSGGVEIGPEGIHSKMTITEDMMKENNLETLEHIDVRVWIEHSKRGDVEVEITSPNGIKSKLASRRQYDRAPTGFPGWRFMSVKHWGENPVGVWTLSVFDQQDLAHGGKVLGWSMALWGESIDPAKATKFVEPVVDNALQPQEDNKPAATPTIHSTSSTTFPRPTENISIVTVTATATPKPTTSPQADDELKQWYETMLNSQKWYYMIFGAIIGLLFGLGFWFWRRKVSERKRAQYASLAADDMPMEAVAENQPLQSSTRGGGQEDPDSERSALISAENARGLGFHTGFLDDDEPTAPRTAPPEYRDYPATPGGS